MTRSLHVVADEGARRGAVHLTRLSPTQAHLALSGAIDTNLGSVVEQLVRQHLAVGRRFIRIDLSMVTTLAPQAAHALRRVHRRALAIHGTLVLSGLGRQPSQLITRLGWDDEFFIARPN